MPQESVKQSGEDLYEQVLETGNQSTGMNALNDAKKEAEGKDDSKKGTIQEPSLRVGELEKLKGSQGASLEMGTAMESDQELFERLTGGGSLDDDLPASSDDTGRTSEGQGEVGDMSKDQLVARIDRMQAQLNRMHDDALIGQQVRKDPMLVRNLADSLQNVTPNNQQPSINEQLGLSEDFTPIPEEFDTPGTDSHKWLNAIVNSRVSEVTNTKLTEFLEQREMQRELEANKKKFIEKYGEDEFYSLANWARDGGNFSMEKLLDYRRLDEARQRRRAGSQYKIVDHTKEEHSTSIGKSPTGRVEGQIDPAQKHAARLLSLAHKNRGPFD